MPSPTDFDPSILGKLKASCEKYKTPLPYPHLPLHTGATGILIPYQTCLDDVPRARIRVDSTEVTLPGPVEGSHHGEHTVTVPRYICQAKPVTVVPYIPAEVFKIAGDATKPLFIVEAPLKALSLTANEMPAIGLGGVLAGATDKDVLEALGEIVLSKEMQRIQWVGRVVYVVFDAGIQDNPMVALGAARLALGLRHAEADVRFVILPFAHPTENDPENGKFVFKADQGPDDFLARNGREAFQKLVDAAVAADPVVRISQAASGSNRTEAVAHLLGELPVQAVLHEGGALIVDQVAAVVKSANIGKAAIQQAVKHFGERLSRRAQSEAPSWKKKLRTTASGSVMASVCNALIVMANDDRIKLALGYDELREEPAWLAAPPWHTGLTWAERPVTDDDATKLVAWLDSEHDFRIPIPTAHAVIDSRAKDRPFHKVREYLASVTHDGVERVAGRKGPGWLTTYFGVPDSPYVRAVGRKTLISAVARIRHPGCKVDTMLVLEGEQGKMKSSAIEALFGSDFFSDQLSEVTTKDASSDLRGKWVIEWSELDNLSRPESSAVKKYISRKIDDYRPSYGRRNVRVPRQCVFVGTVNGDSYLKDETGNRRFWPVRCTGDIDIEAVRRDRDQLWAEAVALYVAKESWWFASDEPELLEAARDEQAARRVEDPWESVVAKGLEAGEEETTDAEMNVVKVARPAIQEVTTEHVLGTILSIPLERQNRAVQMRAGSVMHALGWTRVQRRVGGRPSWVYVRPEAATVTEPPSDPSEGGAEPVPEGGVTTVTTVTTMFAKSEADPDSLLCQRPLQNAKTGGDGSYGGDSSQIRLRDAVTTSESASSEGGDGGDSSAASAPEEDDDDEECRRAGLRAAGWRDDGYG